MKKNTFKDYKVAIKEQYEQSKAKDASGILAHPTPAQLRHFCMLMCDKGLSKKDEEVFGLFFERREGEALKKAIDRVNIDKFKTVISFLKGNKDTDNSTRVELAAILVDFEARPYVVFSNLVQQVEVATDKVAPEVQLPSSTREDLTTIPQPPLQSDRFLIWFEKNKFPFLLCILFLAVSVSGLLTFLFSKEDCMQWQVDHYVSVACEGEQHSLMASTIIPADKRLTDFRKIVVDKTTVFFAADGKPLIWYCKVNAHRIDFFTSNGNGFHPETGKALRPVSQYIVNKYVLGKK